VDTDASTVCVEASFDDDDDDGDVNDPAGRCRLNR
jgi:hypothetical protein